MIRLLAVAGILFDLCSAAVFAEQRKMVIIGTGQHIETPDMASVTVGVNSFAKSAADALTLNSAAMNAVFAVLKASGVEGRDMQTSGLSLFPHWNNRPSGSGPAELDGFEVANTLRIRVRDLDNLGAILDQITRAGANHIQSISFGLQNPKPALNAARRAAVADAQDKAALYAAAAGLELGEILRIDEGGRSPPAPGFARMAAMESSAVPIAAGETVISANVTVEFAIR